MTQPTKPDSTRETILATGRKLVTVQGFGGMGLSTLLKASGVPKGSFYHYFPSKEAFGQALLQDYVDDYLARVDAILARDLNGADKLLTFCDAWLDHEREAGLVNTCLVVKLGAEVADLSDTMRAVLDAGARALVTRLAAMLREGVADGSLRLQDLTDQTAHHAAQVLYAQFLGAAILSKLAHDPHPLEAVVQDIKTRLVTGA
ncbi:TetR/AcrR family transcriptional regulator [Rhodalgimonas zhirmunskyi]|uniref:TetR/AcrR family transcriptional regulator n=1 Tax=Rhodalgimonas zhirmunskyi TaxID=2964767 RepID=A0AAJ1UBH5_9RHOB|nr:TetR/AcrR family transcriptional regulator [Rhodoalgimonas zhirmunskyi]MDQ2095430.1 TetR/AcrR family transcriptional regulator [Rhodoalgimonas zhirmunskyi]